MLRPVLVWIGKVRQGRAGMARPDRARRDRAGYGVAVEAEQGALRRVLVGRGRFGCAWRDEMRIVEAVEASHDVLDMAWSGQIGSGKMRQGRRGGARCVEMCLD